MTNTGKWKVIELLDPQAPLMPRYILCAHREREAPWRTVWKYRERLGSRLALWFKQLESRGLRPIERVFIGGVVGLEDGVAPRLCRARIEHLREHGGADLNTLRPLPPRRGNPRPVVRIRPDGTMSAYKSAWQAAKAVGITTAALSTALWEGAEWFDF